MRRASLLLCVCVAAACREPTAPSNPLPILEAVSPASVLAGTGPDTIVVTGQGFGPESRVRIDSRERATTAIAPTELRVALQASDLATPRVLTLEVNNPEPGGGTSGALQILVTSSPPQVDSIVPEALPVGGPAVTIRIFGRSFHANSVVRWNSAVRPTRFVSDEALDVDLTAADQAVAGRMHLAVVNDSLDGGAAEYGYAVNNAQPTIASLSPDHASVGSAPITLAVAGSHFVPGAIVRWNGAPRPTKFSDSEHLTAQVLAADLVAPDTVAISVANPDPVVSSSSDRSFTVYANWILDIHARDLAWDPVRARLYASVQPDDSRYANQVVAIDPISGRVTARVSVGIGPQRIAISDDASFLYAALDSEGAIVRIDLGSFAPDLRFALGSSDFGTLYASDLEVMPGSPHTVAVSRVNRNFEPYLENVALYDDGVMRRVTTPRWRGGDLIEFASPTTLYGYDNESSGFFLYRMDATDSGLVVRDTKEGLIEQFWADFRYASGYLFSTEGDVVDAATGWRVATTGVQGLVCPEPQGGRVYYLNRTTLYAVNTATWTLVGTAPSSVFYPWYAATRWGEDGLAYIGPTQIAIFRSQLIGG